MDENYNLIIILGPTASGKTRLATRLSVEIGAEIISADSRQVYREMSIGTGKDLAEYEVDHKLVPYHLIDIVDAGEEYNVHLFQRDFFKVFDEITRRNKIPIMCGGTGLYIDAVLKGYAHSLIQVDLLLRSSLEKKTKEELLVIYKQLPDSPYKKLADLSTSKRLIRAIEICNWEQTNMRDENDQSKLLQPLAFGINTDRILLIQKIRDRLENRLMKGLVEEVQFLLNKGIPAEKLIYYGLEYKFVTNFLKGELSMDEMTEKLAIAIRQFAKRQMTYFRKMEREGLVINWIDSSLSLSDQVSYVLQMMKIRTQASTDYSG